MSLKEALIIDTLRLVNVDSKAIRRAQLREKTNLRTRQGVGSLCTTVGAKGRASVCPISVLRLFFFSKASSSLKAINPYRLRPFIF